MQLVDEFDDDEYEMRFVVDAAQTPSFLTDKRVVVARDVGRFNADELKPMLEYLPGAEWLTGIPHDQVDYFIHPTHYTCTNTLADLEGRKRVGTAHLAEALQYRHPEALGRD